MRAKITRLLLFFMGWLAGFGVYGQSDESLAGVYNSLEWTPGNREFTDIPQVWAFTDTGQHKFKQSYVHSYLEARYNYEDAQALSLYWGGEFDVITKHDSVCNFGFTPMIGLVAGNLNAASLGLSMQFGQKALGYIQFNEEFENVLVMPPGEIKHSFFFNWSKLSASTALSGHCKAAYLNNFSLGLIFQFQVIYQSQYSVGPMLKYDIPTDKIPVLSDLAFLIYVYDPRYSYRTYGLAFNIEFGNYSAGRKPVYAAHVK